MVAVTTRVREPMVRALRERRKELGYTLEKYRTELQRLGASFTLPQLSLIERGSRRVDIGEWPYLVKALKLDQTDLMASKLPRK